MEITTTNYWDLEKNVSNGFNRLKAKLYNLIEATIQSKEQKEAIKGLIKGFSNDEFRLCIRFMRLDAKAANFIHEGTDDNIPEIAEPLEQKI